MNLAQPYRKVRMGMVGGGQGAFIGAVHRMAAALDGRVELVCGSFSRNFENTKRTGAELGLSNDRVYPTYEDMFSEEAHRSPEDRMECVAIVTPNHLHVPVALAAFDHGFHVLSDKPAGISLDEVTQLAARLEASDCLYGLTLTYLGYPMVWQARALIAAGEIGRLSKIYIEYPQGWLARGAHASGDKSNAWRVDPARAGRGGAIADIGIHAHSLVEFVTGDQMSRVAAFLRTHDGSRRLDDDSTVQFELSGGASGTLIASQICTGEENALRLRIYGERGSLEWCQMEPNTLIERRIEGAALHHRAGTDTPLCTEALARCRLPSGHPEGYLEAFANLYRDFAAAIRSGRKGTAYGVPGIKEAVRGMAFIEAALESHRSENAWCGLEMAPSLTGKGIGLAV